MLAGAPEFIPEYTKAPTNLRGWLVISGLGTPLRRAVLAAALAVGATALAKPSISFTPDGEMKTLRVGEILEDEEDTHTHVHAATFPVAAAVLVYLLT